jgi:hypothetical protein
MKKNILKISVVSVVSALLLCNANAAPTVKKLGVSAPGLNVTPQKVDNTTSVARVGSLRAKTPAGLGSNSVPTKIAGSGLSGDTQSRLALSNYLHGKQKVKTTTSTGPGVASNEFIELRDHVENTDVSVQNIQQTLETVNETVNQTSGDLAEHVQNQDVHVREGERETWNAKQDALTAGPGIDISDGVISSVMSLPVGGEQGQRSAPIWVE